MNRRRVLVNVGLGVVVLGLGAAGAAALMSPREDPLANLTTTTVSRGVLEATVTASGNTISGRTASLQMPGSGGTIEEVYVATGQRVKSGDELVRVDDTSARQQLDSALVQLDSAKASYLTATQGQTSAEREADAASVASAEQGLENAKDALASAKASLKLTKRQQSELVDDAQSAVGRAAKAKEKTENKIAEAEAQLAAADPADPTTTETIKAHISTLKTQVATERTTLSQAKSALAQAKRTRDSAVQQADQAVTSAAGNRDAARASLAQQEATVKVNRQAPKQGAIDAAQAQVDSAQLAVDQAQAALDDTVLRAPFDGVVSTVNAVVGQSSSAPASSVDGSSGLVTLVDPDGMRVTASVAEADATSIRIGQSASVTLPASGILMTGEVDSIDVEGTVTNNVVQYVTTLSLQSPPEEVRVGQTVSISILTGSKEDALFVPTSAIAVDGATSSVTKVADGRLSEVEVTTGLVGTTGTEVVSGLDEGDVILLSNDGDDAQAGAFPGPGIPTR